MEAGRACGRIDPRQCSWRALEVVPTCDAILPRDPERRGAAFDRAAKIDRGHGVSDDLPYRFCDPDGVGSASGFPHGFA